MRHRATEGQEEREGAEPGRQPERMLRGDLGTGHRWSGADCTADGQSHAERPRQAQHPQRVTARQQTQTGRREPQNAVSGAFRARYRYIILYPYMNRQRAETEVAKCTISTRIICKIYELSVG